MTRLSSLLVPLGALLALSSPARADETSLSQSSQPPERVSFLIAYGEDSCPEASGDEIVVCAQRPESDRYRVPVELRGADDDVAAGGGSWASAVEAHDDIARLNRPNSCSAVGSYGFTGCAAAALRQWFAERRTP